MEASSDTFLGQGSKYTFSNSRGQSTFRIYYGIMRKALLIACLQQRRSRIIAESEKKGELLYLKDPSALAGKIDNGNSQCEEQFSDDSTDITEEKATDSTPDNFRVSTLSLFHQNLQQKIQESNGSDPYAKSPGQKSDLIRSLHIYESLGIPRMAIILPRPRKAAIITFRQKRGFRNWIFAENETKESSNTAEIINIESKENNFKISRILQENFQQNLKSKTFFKTSELQRAFHIYEPLVLPRMAIVLPNPLRGRTLQYLATHHMDMSAPEKDEIWGREKAKRQSIQEQLQTILDTLRSLEGVSDSYALQAQISRSSYKAIDIILISLLIILTVFVFYFIWTCPLPEEILVTFSGMYSLLMSYMYFLIYN